MNKDILVDVVNGTSHWEVLKAYGVRRVADTWYFPPNIDPLEISGRDLELGFASYASDPACRKEWAEFMLAASSLVTFEAVEREQGGDALLERLWNAASSENHVRGT